MRLDHLLSKEIAYLRILIVPHDDWYWLTVGWLVLCGAWVEHQTKHCRMLCGGGLGLWLGVVTGSTDHTVCGRWRLVVMSGGRLVDFGALLGFGTITVSLMW